MLKKARYQVVTVRVERLLSVEDVGEMQEEVDVKDLAQLEDLLAQNPANEMTVVSNEIEESSIDWEI